MNLENFIAYVEMAKQMLIKFNYLCPVANLIKCQTSTPLMLNYDTPFQSAFSWFKAGAKARMQESEVVLMIHVSALNNVENCKSNTGILFTAIKVDGTCEVEFLPFVLQEGVIVFEDCLCQVSLEIVKDVTKFVLAGWKAVDADTLSALRGETI